MPVNESFRHELGESRRNIRACMNENFLGIGAYFCAERTTRAGIAVMIAQQTTCLYAVVDLAGSSVVRICGYFRRSLRKTTLLRNMITRVVAVSVLLMPVCAFSGDQAAETASEVRSAEYEASIEERTQGATKGRAQAQESVNALSGEIQELKKSVIALNKNLRVLEEDLLFPANTQVNVFLSMDVGKYFALETVKVKLDGKVVASHIYSNRELKALAKGGIHKLHMANLSIGEHTLSAFFTGTGPNGRDYKRGTTLAINKENGPKYVELAIADSSVKQQPEFSVREW